MNVWAYLLSAQDPQDKFSREAQQQQLRDYVARCPNLAGCSGEPLWVEDDERSATLPLPKRLNGDKLVAAVSQGDHLITLTLERCWPYQTVPTAVHWIDEIWRPRGIHFHLVDGVPGFANGVNLCSDQGLFVLAGMKTAIQQGRRSRTANRHRAVQKLKAEGRAVCPPGVGYRLAGRGKTRRVEPDPFEQQVAAEIYVRIKQGESPGQISRSLREAGLHRRSRRKWSENCVKAAYKLVEQRKNSENRPAG